MRILFIFILNQQLRSFYEIVYFGFKEQLRFNVSFIHDKTNLTSAGNAQPGVLHHLRHKN